MNQIFGDLAAANQLVAEINSANVRQRAWVEKKPVFATPRVVVQFYHAEEWAQYFDATTAAELAEEDGYLSGGFVLEGSHPQKLFPAAVVNTTADGFVAVEGIDRVAVLALLSEVTQAHPLYGGR